MLWIDNSIEIPIRSIIYYNLFLSFDACLLKRYQLFIYHQRYTFVGIFKSLIIKIKEKNAAMRRTSAYITKYVLLVRFCALKSIELKITLTR